MAIFWHLMELIKNNIIPDDYELISLDVVAMFPSIPQNLVLEHLEVISLNKLKSSIVLNSRDNFFSKDPKNCKSPVLFYKRYVDDCLLIVDKKSIKKTIDTFNIYHKDLQFT